MTTTATVEPMQKDVKIFLWATGLFSAGILGGFIFWQSRSAPVSVPAANQRVQEFTLTERSGAEVSRASLSNQFLVVNFVHTGCSITCEQVNKRMAEVQQIVAGQDDIRLLSLSIDPVSDTPAALRDFASRFGADERRWLFLTGNKPAVYDLIEGSFLTRNTNSLTRSMPFLGVEQIAVVDKDGQIRRFFNGLKRGTPLAIAETIQQLRGGTFVP